MNRRKRRSNDRNQALQYLVEALAERSDVSSVALVTEGGDVVAGTGTVTELHGLAQIAGPVARAEPSDKLEEVTLGTDCLGREIHHKNATLYLAALGSRLQRVRDAVDGVTRILDDSARVVAER